MHKYNQTLHKRSLARKFRVLSMINKGMRVADIAQKMGMTTQRVYALAKAARDLKENKS